jgi:hypothetical protein
MANCLNSPNYHKTGSKSLYNLQFCSIMEWEKAMGYGRKLCEKAFTLVEMLVATSNSAYGKIHRRESSVHYPHYFAWQQVHRYLQRPGPCNYTPPKGVRK